MLVWNKWYSIILGIDGDNTEAASLLYVIMLDTMRRRR